MLTNEEVAEALSRPTAIEELHIDLRRQIDDDILDRPADTIQSIFDRHGLACRRVSRATFYRYARKLRLLRSAADLDQLLGPDGPTREKLFAGLQNGLLYQLTEVVNAEELDAGLIQKLTQSLKSLVTTDIQLQKHATYKENPTPQSPRREPRVSAPNVEVAPNSPPTPNASPQSPRRQPGVNTPNANDASNDSPSPHDSSPLRASTAHNPQSAPPSDPDNIHMIICRTRPFRPSTSCRTRRCNTRPPDST